jgi:hypothetical protein
MIRYKGLEAGRHRCAWPRSLRAGFVNRDPDRRGADRSINGLLAMSELAVVSSRPARLKVLSDQGGKGAATAMRLAEASRPLSLDRADRHHARRRAVGRLLRRDARRAGLSGWLLARRVSHQAVSDTLGVGSVVVAITYLSLIVGELVPKQIALRDPERVAARVAPAMSLLSKVGAPLVFLLDISGKAVLRAAGPEGRVGGAGHRGGGPHHHRRGGDRRRAGAGRARDDRGRDAPRRSLGARA